MKKICFILAFVFLLSSCNNHSGTSSQNVQSDIPSDVQSEISKEEAEQTVKVNWEYLDKDSNPLRVGTRLKKEYIKKLIPSDNYGKLVPFLNEMLGEVVDETGKQELNLFGLMTKEGCVVLDAVCTNIINYGDCYVLNNGTDKKALYAIAAIDGRWVTDYKYTGVFTEDIGKKSNVIIGIIDDSKKNFDVIDIKTGKLIFNSVKIGLADKIGYFSVEGGMFNYSDYFCIVSNKEDANGNNLYEFYNKKGQLLKSDTFEGSTREYSVFKNGLAYVNIDANKKGYINESGDLVFTLDSDTEWGGYFCSKKVACIKTKNLNTKVIDNQGKILHTFENEEVNPVVYDDILYFIGEKGIYDSKYKEIKSKSGANFLSSSWWDTLRGIAEDNSSVYIKGKEYPLKPGDYCKDYLKFTDNYYNLQLRTGDDKIDSVIFDNSGKEICRTTGDTGIDLVQAGDTEIIFEFDYTSSGVKLINLTDDIIIENVVRGVIYDDEDLVCCYDGVSLGVKNIHNGKWVYRTPISD